MKDTNPDHWDNTQTYFCQGKVGLIHCLKQARIEAQTYMTVRLGYRQFSIERIHGNPSGFHIIEPNDMYLEPGSITRKLFKTIEELAQEFYDNYIEKEDDYLAFSICFFSYGNTQCELEHTLQCWEANKDQSDLYPTLKRLIAHYRQAKLSRIDFVITLYDEIEEIKKRRENTSVALNFLQSNLNTYLKNQKITQHQENIDEIIKAHTKYVKLTESRYKISWLYLAIAVNQIWLVKKLLTNGADPNCALDDKATPLYIATQNGQVEIVRLLLDHGADPNCALDDKTTPLYIAACRGYVEIVQLLLAKGADLNYARDDKATPLYIAAQNGQVETVRLLLDHGADPNCAREDKATPLYIAVQYRQVEIVRLLLDHGADPNCALDGNFTPLYIAVQYSRQVEIVRLLLDHGADSKYANQYGDIPLTIATKSKNLKIIKILLIHANPEQAESLEKIDDKDEATLLTLGTQQSTTRLIHDDILDNYNILAKELKNKNFPVQELNKNGVCAGISNYYFKYAKKNKRNKYFACLKFIALLKDKQSVTALVNQYYTEGENLRIVPAPGETAIPFKRLLHFLQGIGNTHKNQTFKTIDMDWDNTQTYFCQGKTELIDRLKQARIEEQTYMAVLLGRHQFSIERIHDNPSGFYIIEPNNMRLEAGSITPKLFKTVEEVAEEFYDNYEVEKENDYLAFSICFLSYGNTQHELENAIQLWETNKDHDLYPTLKRLIAHYRKGQQSRIDLALTLCDEIEEIKKRGENTSEALNLLQSKLGTYLKDQKITQHQENIDAIIKTHPEYVKHTASRYKTSWLWLAVALNQSWLVKKLLTNDADPNCAREDTVTPLYIAAQDGHVEIVQMLLANGADPNCALDDKATPLHIATRKGHVEIVKLLLDHGADPNCASDDKTPLHIANWNGYKTIEDILNCAIAFNSVVQSVKNEGRISFFFTPNFDNDLSKAYQYHSEYFQEQLCTLLNGNTLTSNQLKKLCTTKFIQNSSHLFNPELTDKITNLIAASDSIVSQVVNYFYSFRYNN